MLAEKITGQIQVNEKQLQKIKLLAKNIESFKRGVGDNLSQNTSVLVEILMAGAIILDASDIHLEPEEEKIKLRLRIDGILQDVFLFEPAPYKGLLSRIKLLSGIKLNITDKAQDGRFTVILGKAASDMTAGRTSSAEDLIEIRVSTLPSEFGEAVVMRILNPKSLINVEQLGIREDMIDVFNAEISQPNGMIIVTGPTGSGKTTTLYAILKKIRNPEIKIITIEDPIEYHLEGISQSQANPAKGYDFANGLRAIVRQDPDVILVGEIRDLETASIALQASLTGHLVLSTLHTNDAAGTIARLQALGEKPENIAPALNLAVAQRLLRKVCPKCVKMTKPSPQEIAKIREVLKELPKKIREQMKISLQDPDLKVPKPQGCPACNLTGYKGRVGIYEFFLIDDDMEEFITKSPSVAAMRKKAREKGMVTIKEDGFIKVLLGVTTIEEVEKVTGAELSSALR